MTLGGSSTGSCCHAQVVFTNCSYASLQVTVIREYCQGPNAVCYNLPTGGWVLGHCSQLLLPCLSLADIVCEVYFFPLHVDTEFHITLSQPLSACLSKSSLCSGMLQPSMS